MALFRLLFTWWSGATIGTHIMTWFKGQRVGDDKYGNRYYQSADKKRRWVIYKGSVDASRVPPDWHGWLHHTFREPPTVKAPVIKSWEKDHRPNMTGTDGAYHPPGSLAGKGERPPATGDYEAWKPE
jgi:NADH:ubiquinone oxidoreductase subunit